MIANQLIRRYVPDMANPVQQLPDMALKQSRWHDIARTEQVLQGHFIVGYSELPDTSRKETAKEFVRFSCRKVAEQRQFSPSSSKNSSIDQTDKLTAVMSLA